MALDFPSNPVDGQISGNFVWSASTGAWKAKPSTSTVTIHSSTAPTSANAGDVWFNTNNGISFTYYNDGTSSQWVEMVSSSVPAISTIMPVGTVVATARSTAPSGWVLCDGSSYSTTDQTYAELYAAIGTTYGSGTGTFKVPNLNGRSIVGVGTAATGSGVTAKAIAGSGGDEMVTLTSAQIPAHSHPNTITNGAVASSTHTHYEGDLKAAIGAVNGNPGWLGYPATSVSSRGPSSVTAYTVYGNNYSSSSLGFNHYTPVYGTTGAPNSTVTVGITNANNTGGDGAHNNLSPYLVLNYMIKY